MRSSLKRKLPAAILLTVVVVSFLGILFLNNTVSRIDAEDYNATCVHLAKTVALSVDTSQVREVRDAVSSLYDSAPQRVSNSEQEDAAFKDYVRRYDAITHSEAYASLYQSLRALQEANEVRGLYLAYADDATQCMVYLVDASDENPCLPGTFDVLEGEDLALFDNPDDGYDPSITNTPEYGWNIATAKPIYDDGSLIAYACVDISMNEVMEDRGQSLREVIGMVVVVAAVFGVASIACTDRSLVKPIEAMSAAAVAHYDGGAGAMSAFEGLSIHTGDELEVLAQSMTRMEQDIRNYATRMNQIANSDSLTGVRNKRAYDLEIQRANEWVRAEGTAVGIAVVDLNYLKNINDTYGHDKGDVALRALCRLVCVVFDHSPVFRIGGDEFAVVLRGHDLEHIDQLLGEFYAKIDDIRQDDTLEPWDQISAAVGYAVYDSDLDTCVEDVFKRADERMYEKKKMMKGVA